jgi:hypothetical protein
MKAGESLPDKGVNALVRPRKHGPEAQNRRGGAPKGVRAYRLSARCCAQAQRRLRHGAFRRSAPSGGFAPRAASPHGGAPPLGGDRETSLGDAFHVMTNHRTGTKSGPNGPLSLTLRVPAVISTADGLGLTARALSFAPTAVKTQSRLEEAGPDIPSPLSNTRTKDVRSH